MKHSGARTYNTGDEWPAGGIQTVTHDPLTAASGWNLIGGYELSATTATLQQFQLDYRQDQYINIQVDTR